MNFPHILTVISVSLALVAYSTFSHAAVELNWVGCGISKKAYVTSLAKSFEKKTGIKINIQGGGAARGIRDVVKGDADLGGSCRYILPDDPREAGVGLEPVAWDALVVIVNKNNPVDSISLSDVRSLFDGKITNWTALGGNDAPIDLFVRKSKNSGVGRTLRKLIYADFDKELASTQKFKSSGPLEKTVVKSPNAIAITGISSARLRDVKILKLDGVAPTVTNVRSGAYRLYRPLYLTYNADSPNIAEVRKFIKFCHSAEGRREMKENGVVPYKEALSLIMKQIQQDDTAFKEGLALKAN